MEPKPQNGLWDPVVACLKALVNHRAAAPVCPASLTPDTERFLLDYGRHWLWRNDRLPKSVRPGPLQLCFQNAAAAALTNADLIYVEGWAATQIYRPVGHAWCIEKHTLRVVDSTWEPNHQQRIYFGISFKTSYLRFFKSRARRELSILGWSEADWPVQTGRVPREVWEYFPTDMKPAEANGGRSGNTAKARSASIAAAAATANTLTA